MHRRRNIIPGIGLDNPTVQTQCKAVELLPIHGLSAVHHRQKRSEIFDDWDINPSDRWKHLYAQHAFNLKGKKKALPKSSLGTTARAKAKVPSKVHVSHPGARELS